MPKEKRATWFKMFLRHKALFDALDNEGAGIAIKAIMKYFEVGQVPDNIPPAARVLVCAIKPDIDDCMGIYAVRCENGKLGGRPRKDNGNHTKPHGYLESQDKPCETEDRSNSLVPTEVGRSRQDLCAKRFADSG